MRIQEMYLKNMSCHKDTYNSSPEVKITIHFYYHADALISLSLAPEHASISLLHIITRYPKYTSKSKSKSFYFFSFNSTTESWISFPENDITNPSSKSKAFTLEISISYDTVTSGSVPLSQNLFILFQKAPSKSVLFHPLNLGHHHFLP